MEKVAFKPLGTIVTIKGSPKKFMIIARALFSKKDHGTPLYFDYGAVMYPEGLIGSQLVYFQDRDIASVVFEGFDDSENKAILDRMYLELERKDVVRCDLEEISKMKREYVARIPMK